MTLSAQRDTVGARLSPGRRRRHLIDAARTIVVDDGISSLTMDHLASTAGVSRALVYNYFGNRAGLVGQLWEDVAFEWGGDPMPPITDEFGQAELEHLFENRLTITTSWYFDMIESGGILLARLMTDPDLGGTVADFRSGLHDLNVVWWTDLCERLGLGHDQSVVFATMFNRAVESLWDLVASGSVDRTIVEQTFSSSARAAFDALRHEPIRA